MRVFIGIKEVSGVYANLTHGLHELGIVVHAVGIEGHPFGYIPHPSSVTPLTHLFDVSERARRRSSGGGRVGWTVINGAARMALIIFSVGFHDVILSTFGSSLLPRFLDLRIARWFGRTVVANVGHGSEARPPYINGALFDRVPSERELHKLRATTRQLRRWAVSLQRIATRIIASPMTSQFYSRRLVNWFELGIPFMAPSGVDSLVVEERSAESGRPAPLVLHAPSRRWAKGTWFVRDAVAQVRAAGVTFEYREVSGLAHTQLLSLIAASSLVVDQAFSDSPMPAISAEAAAFGVPAVIGGYGWTDLATMMSVEALPPTVRCRPEELASVIAAVLRDQASDVPDRARLQSYMSRFLNPRIVAERYLKVFTGDYPAAWEFDPRDVTYCHGVGLREADARQSIRAFAGAFGPSAMGLDHNLSLRTAFLEFAR